MRVILDFDPSDAMDVAQANQILEAIGPPVTPLSPEEWRALDQLLMTSNELRQQAESLNTTPPE